jgi:ATP-dependent Clp protease ATP-binding subunit ClpC
MLDRFSDRAKKVMELARQEAGRLNSPYIGPEHMLLGLLRIDGGLGHATLQGLLGDLTKLGTEVETLAGATTAFPAGGGEVAGTLPLTFHAKRVLEVALEEAADFKHNYVGTEHLLLGLLRDPEGVAAWALKNQGLSLEQVRREVIHRLPHPLGAD